MSSVAYSTSPGEAESQGTVAFDQVLWKKAINLVSAVFYHQMPEEQRSRIAPATALAMQRKVRYVPDERLWTVPGQKKMHVVTVSTCDCDDFKYQKAPRGVCKHRHAVRMTRLAQQLSPEDLQGSPEQLMAKWKALQAESSVPPKGPGQGPPHAVPPPAGDGEGPREDGEKGSGKPEETAEIPHGIDPRFLEMIQDKPYIKYAGLLALAHERGLVQLAARVEFHDELIVFASATATFTNGTSFTEWGDATPQNVNGKIKPHFPRMALTRAKARCLRDALNIGMVAVEEME